MHFKLPKKTKLLTNIRTYAHGLTDAMAQNKISESSYLLSHDGISRLEHSQDGRREQMLNSIFDPTETRLEVCCTLASTLSPPSARLVLQRLE